MSVFLVSCPSLVRDFPLDLDCFILTVSYLLTKNLVSYVHSSSTKISSVLSAIFFLLGCDLLLDIRVTLAPKKKKTKISPKYLYLFASRKYPKSILPLSTLFLLENMTGDPINKLKYMFAKRL